MSTQTFQAKTKEELTSMDISELTSYVANLTAEVEHKDDEHKTAMDDKEKDAKKAMDEKEEEAKKAKKAMDEDHEKDAVVLKAVLKAMDEEDPDKRKEAIKTAMKADLPDKDKKDAMHEDDEEKKALKAEVSYLAAKANKPTIDYLTKVYQAAQTPEDKIKEYIAEWEKMNTKQLDAALGKIKPLVEQMGTESFEADSTKSPFGFSSPSPPVEQVSFSASAEFKKIDEMSPSEAFGSGGPHA